MNEKQSNSGIPSKDSVEDQLRSPLQRSPLGRCRELLLPGLSCSPRLHVKHCLQFVPL